MRRALLVLMFSSAAAALPDRPDGECECGAYLCDKYWSFADSAERFAATPRWWGEPEADPVVIVDGKVMARLRLRLAPDERGAPVRVRARGVDGRVMLDCVGQVWNLGAMAYLPLYSEEPDGWPDRVLVDLTPLSARASVETRTLELPVIRHRGDDCDGKTSLTERLLLFLALPFLAGSLGGSVLGRRRHR